MIWQISGLIGLVLGAWTAKRRGGNAADMAQYGAGYGIAFMVLGVIATVVVHRMSM